MTCQWKPSASCAACRACWRLIWAAMAGLIRGSHPDAAAQSAPRALLELVACFDIVRASVEDCALLLGAVAVADDAALRATLATLLAQGPAIAMITLGERGCLVATQEGFQQIPAQCGEVIDTTGAGDAFFSAFPAAVSAERQRGGSGTFRGCRRHAHDRPQRRRPFAALSAAGRCIWRAWAAEGPDTRETHMDRVRFAVIGCGSIAEIAHFPLAGCGTGGGTGRLLRYQR